VLWDADHIGRGMQIWFAVVSPITLLAPSCASAMIPAPNPVLRANISSIAMRS
jgi:hypothetical protein